MLHSKHRKIQSTCFSLTHPSFLLLLFCRTITTHLAFTKWPEYELSALSNEWKRPYSWMMRSGDKKMKSCKLPCLTKLHFSDLAETFYWGIAWLLSLHECHQTCIGNMKLETYKLKVDVPDHFMKRHWSKKAKCQNDWKGFNFCKIKQIIWKQDYFPRWTENEDELS